MIEKKEAELLLSLIERSLDEVHNLNSEKIEFSKKIILENHRKIKNILGKIKNLKWKI